MRHYLLVYVLAVFALVQFWVPVYASNQSNDLPLAAGICVNRANQLIQAGKPNEAVKVLQKFQDQQKGKNHYYIDFMLGNCFMMMDKSHKNTINKNHVNQAAAAYEKAVAKQPALSPAWLNLAQCLYTQGEMAKAAQAFIRGYDTAEVKNADTLYYASACWFFSNNYKAALDTFNQLLDRHKTLVKLEWKEILVNTLFALDKNRQALPWLKELAQDCTGKKQKQWQEVLLYQYVTLGMDKEALDYGLYLTRNDPGESKWWKSLAHIHLGKNRLEKGLQSLMIYGFLTPLTPSETILLADLYSACNIPLEAARCYENWVAHADDTSYKKEGNTLKVLDKILKIAVAYMHGGDKDAALAWAEKGLALQMHPGLLRFKADLLFRDKQYKAACDAYEDLADFKSEQGRAWLMAGYAAWNQGQFNKAAKAFELAAHHPKQNRTAQNALGQIKRIQSAHVGMDSLIGNENQ